jgi:tRNA threonylcarbamoyladenosine biosynthesis protein TsaE
MPVIEVPDEYAMRELGRSWSGQIEVNDVLFFQGELGAGKTTLVRGILEGFGFLGNVVSPTYTLVEPYSVAGRTIYHFDLFRMESPQELEYIGFRDMIGEESISLVEWPERGNGVLPAADHEISISYSVTGKGRRVATNLIPMAQS